MLRFLHLSDIHFDAVYGRYPEVVRAALKSGLYKAFERAIDFAIENRVDMVIMAGDVCDRPDVSYETESFVRKHLHRLGQANIKSVLIHGNHDPSSVLKWKDLSDHVHIVTSPNPVNIQMLAQDGNEVVIHANGFELGTEKKSELDSFEMGSQEGYHIGVMHTYATSGLATEDHAPYMQTSLNELGRKKYDYWALGHIHKMEVFGEHKAAYSGSIQGLHANEMGGKGGLLVEIDSPGGQPHVEFVEFSPIEFLTLNIDIQKDYEDLHRLSKMAADEITTYKNQAEKKKSYIVRLKLEGASKLYDDLMRHNIMRSLESEIREEAQVLAVEILTDKVTPFVDKAEVISASPFALFIDEMLSDETMKDELIAYAMKKSFAELPKEETLAKNHLETLLKRVGDDWLYKMVKNNED